MSNIVRVDAWREIDFSSVTANYTVFGSRFGHAMRVLHFINETDGDIAISFDGTTNNIPIFAGTFALYDLTSDQDANESFRYEKGTQLYVKYISLAQAPTTGTLYCVAIFGKGE